MKCTFYLLSIIMLITACSREEILKGDLKTENLKGNVKRVTTIDEHTKIIKEYDTEGRIKSKEIVGYNKIVYDTLGLICEQQRGGRIEFFENILEGNKVITKNQVGKIIANHFYDKNWKLIKKEETPGPRKTIYFYTDGNLVKEEVLDGNRNNEKVSVKTFHFVKNKLMEEKEVFYRDEENEGNIIPGTNYEYNKEGDIIKEEHISSIEGTIFITYQYTLRDSLNNWLERKEKSSQFEGLEPRIITRKIEYYTPEEIIQSKGIRTFSLIYRGNMNNRASRSYNFENESMEAYGNGMGASYLQTKKIKVPNGKQWIINKALFYFESKEKKKSLGDSYTMAPTLFFIESTKKEQHIKMRRATGIPEISEVKLPEGTELYFKTNVFYDNVNIFGKIDITEINMNHKYIGKEEQSNLHKTQNIEKSHNVPQWLIGTWSGKFTKTQYGISITVQYTITIGKDGSICEITDVDGEREILLGSCKYTNGQLSANYDGETVTTTYQIDNRNQRLGVGDGYWLNKRSSTSTNNSRTNSSINNEIARYNTAVDNQDWRLAYSIAGNIAQYYARNGDNTSYQTWNKRGEALRKKIFGF